MTESLIQAELLAACSGLGYNDGIRYHKETECLETVKDLIRYLRRDDDSHQIRRALGETKVLQTDLIPIIKFYSDNEELFDVTLRLLVNLTNPVMLLFNEELPEEKITRQQYLQMASHQQTFKLAFADEEFWKILVSRLSIILKKENEERAEEDKLVVERILILVRNVLSVAASPEEEKRTDDDASIHDQVLWSLHLARFQDLLLYIASSEKEQELCMHVLEIVSLMLKEQDASQLANAGMQRSRSEKEKDDKELSDIRKREALRKKQKFQKHYSSRHSKFGGVFYVRNMKSISDRDIIAHKHITDITSLNFDNSKRPKKIPKNRLPLKDVDIMRRSTLAIRLFLQEFCIEFLNGAFNSIMFIVKDNLCRGKTQEHDEAYYLWSIKFFLEFNINHQFKVELISETLNIQTFHYIQMQLDHYYESMTTDKKKIPHWSKRMHRALKAYKELLMTLSYMDTSEIASVRESSVVLKSKIFYVVEYRELVLMLLQNYDELKMTKSYLKDLVETTHIFLKHLEQFCGKQKHVIVQGKSKSKKKRTAKKASANVPKNEEELQIQWEENLENIVSVVTGNAEELPAAFPFDPVSDVSEEVQKEIAMKKINALLRNWDIKEAVSLLRSARDIWPEGDIFGSQNSSPDMELSSLKIIYMANINPPDEEGAEAVEENETDSEEEGEIRQPQISEGELNFMQYVRRFSHTKVIQAYSLLFKEFYQNSEYTNHCILKMFHRLAWDCKLVAIFFQASIFRTFQQMLDHSSCTTHSNRDAVKFIKFILRKFFEIAETNKKVYIEILFWKTNKEALEIECGYGDLDSDSKNSKKAIWREEEEDELKRLYEEFKSNPRETDDGEDKDIVDLILSNIIDQTRTRRLVIKKLKELGLIQDAKDLHRKPVKTRLPTEFSEDEKSELRDLVAKFKDSMNPVARIMDHLTIKRPKNRLIKQILEMGLVQDRKELRKKRQSKNNDNVYKSRKIKNEGERFLVANENSRDDSTDESSSDEIDNQDESDSGHSLSVRDDTDISHIVVSPALQANFAEVVQNHGEALNWVSELLLETADERSRDGDFEAVPLLAVTENCSDAMEDEEFQSLLRQIGIQPPRSHQEMFWRIPSTISVDGLRKRVHIIQQGISGQLDDSNIAGVLQNVPLKNVEKKRSATISTKRTLANKESALNGMESSEDEALVNVAEFATKTGDTGIENSGLSHDHPEIIASPGINWPKIGKQVRVISSDDDSDDNMLLPRKKMKRPIIADSDED